MWRCLRCKRVFANRDQPHSCVVVPIEKHLQGKSDDVVHLYREFVKLIHRCGPVKMAPAKTRIGFQVRMIFAAVTLKQKWLAGHLVLDRRVDNPRFHKIDSISPRNHVHHFRVRSPEELDDEFGRLICEAYRVGEQKHLERR